MKYPKEYAKKALDVIEKNYLTEDGLKNVELLTLAAFAIDIICHGAEKEGIDLNFEQILGAITKPEPYKYKEKDSHGIA